MELGYTGDGIAGDTDLITQRLLWIDVGHDIPRLEGQQVFVRAVQNHRTGILEPKTGGEWNAVFGLTVSEGQNW